MTNNPADRDRIIERIRRCLALGDKSRNPSEHEAENAVRIAKSLMDEYNLTMADVATQDGQVAGRMTEACANPNKVATPPVWEQRLPRVCNALFSTYSYFTCKWNEETKDWNNRVIMFVGEEVDVALACEVYKLLKLEVMALGSKWEREHMDDLIELEDRYGEQTGTTTMCQMSPGARRTRRWKYQEGIVYTLSVRADEMSETMSKANQAKVTALVLRKQDRAREWATKEHALVTLRSRESGLHRDAMSDGIVDGRKVSLNFKNNVKGAGSGPLALPEGK